MIVGQKVDNREQYSEVITYSLIDGKVVVTNNLFENGVLADHSVEVVNSDQYVSEEQARGWIEAGAI